VTELTQEEQATLAKAVEINQRIAREEEAKRKEKQEEEQKEAQRREEERRYEMKQRPEFQAFVSAFKNQFPQSGLDVDSERVLITLPDGGKMEIQSRYDKWLEEYYYNIEINGHNIEVGRYNGYYDLKIPE